MKKELVKIVAGCLALLLITGCSQKKEPPNIEIGSSTAATASTVEVTQPAGTALTETAPANSTEAVSGFWDMNSKQFGDGPYYFTEYERLREQLGANPAPLLIEGLSYKNPIVRWYCAYQIVEYFDHIDKNSVKKVLQALLKDEQDYVKGAAAFSLAVLNKTYDAPGIVKSPSGKRAAFSRFPEARYNDGIVLVSDNTGVRKIFSDLNASPVSWSPDESFLSISQAARIWINTLVVKVDTLEVLKPEIFQFIAQNSKIYDYETGQNQRPDPYIEFVEWSPDSKKILVHCSFTDDSYLRQACLAVYNVNDKKLDWFLKLPPAEGDHPEAIKPESFNWEAGDYGLKSGSIGNVSSTWFDSSTRKAADAAFKKLVNAINNSDLKALREFTDPQNAHRFTDENLKAALEDYKAFFRNLKIEKTEFVSVHPYQDKTIIYRAFNGDYRFKDFTITLTDGGKFVCTDNFLYYSGYARKLAAAFVEKLKTADAKGLAAVLTVDDLDYPEDMAAQVIENYKKEFELDKLQFEFTGNTTGKTGDGNFEYLIYTWKDNALIQHGFIIVYGDGLAGIKDPYVPEVQ